MPQNYQERPRYHRPQPAFAVDYVPQYDPGMHQMMNQMLAQRQERTDTGKEMMMQQDAWFGQIDTRSPEMLDDRMSSYKKEIQDILEDYGGDPGAARGELMRRIGKEHAAPFYKMNRYQVEQSKMQQQLDLQLGPRSMILNDVTRPGALQEAIETGDMGRLEANVMPRDDYDRIIHDLSKYITPEQREILLQEYRGHGIEGFLQHGSMEYIDEDKRREVAETLLPTFKGLAPSLQFEDQVAGGLNAHYAWTQDDDAIIDRMTQAWAHRDMKQVQRSYPRDPKHQVSKDGKGDGSSPSSMVNLHSVASEDTMKGINRKWDRLEQYVDYVDRIREMGLDDASLGKQLEATSTAVKNHPKAGQFSVKGIADIFSYNHEGVLTPLGQRLLEFHDMFIDDPDTKVYHKRDIKETDPENLKGHFDQVYEFEATAGARRNLVAKQVYDLIHEKPHTTAGKKEAEIAKFIKDNEAMRNLISDQGFTRSEAIGLARDMELHRHKTYGEGHEFFDANAVNRLTNQVENTRGQNVNFRYIDIDGEIKEDENFVKYLRDNELSINKTEILPSENQIAVYTNDGTVLYLEAEDVLDEEGKRVMKEGYEIFEAMFGMENISPKEFNIARPAGIIDDKGNRVQGHLVFEAGKVFEQGETQLSSGQIVDGVYRPYIRRGVRDTNTGEVRWESRELSPAEMINDFVETLNLHYGQREQQEIIRY